MPNPNSKPPHDVAKQTVIDMTYARRLASSLTCVEDVRDFLHHGRAEWETRKRIVSILSADPVFDKSQRQYLSRTALYTRGMALTNRIYELQLIHGWSANDTRVAFASLDEQLPIALHNVAFQPVFTSQSAPSLLASHLPLVSSRAIIGCYLQTELGHGSNVGMLETTARYIPPASRATSTSPSGSEEGEFELHSPTLTSTKWWIGGLGKTATHGVVQAKLLLPLPDGSGWKDLGPHLFLVQLRSLEDHKPLPGITLGDIGPKSLSGFSPTDNGFARFDRVRIPHRNMLAAFAQVKDDGAGGVRYVKPVHAKMSYGGMLYIRANMVTTGGWIIAKAATIAIRYATVRRQGSLGSDGMERQIITYPSVYARLLPILARAYMFIHLGRTLARSFDITASRLKTGSKESDASSLLAELHATTAGLKIYISSAGVEDVEAARRSMGGHGYSAFAGLGRVYADWLPSVTYEGDNYVLDQQVVRAALKAYRTYVGSAHATPSPSSPASELSPSSAYLRHLISPPSPPPPRLGPTTNSPTSRNEWRDPATSIRLLELRAAYMVREHAVNVVDSGSTSPDSDATVNKRVSKAVTDAFVAARVGEMIGGGGASGGLDSIKDERSRELVKKLLVLYLLTTVEGGLTDILSFDLLPIRARSSGSTKTVPRDPTRLLRQTINVLCQKLLPAAIGLTDAFGFTDWELDSSLGLYDGNVYESLWKRAQGEPLNKTVVPAAYEESIKPILQRGRRIAEEAAARTDKSKSKL